MLVCPRVQVNTVEGDSFGTNANYHDEGADLAVEAVFVHAQITWRIPEANEPRRNSRCRSRISHVIPPWGKRTDILT
jgi:hypothetical protein